jgi:hypothetical protein
MPFSARQIDVLRQLTYLWTPERFVLIGAAALGCFLDMRWRGTADLDLTLAISLEEFLDERLIPGWRRDRWMEHRWYAPSGEIVDIIPAGSDLLRKGAVEWPRTGHRMSLLGLRLAFERGVPVAVAPDLSIKVAPVPVLTVLKIVAYEDRPTERERDLADLAYILTEYEPEDRFAISTDYGTGPRTPRSPRPAAGGEALPCCPREESSQNENEARNVRFATGAARAGSRAAHAVPLHARGVFHTLTVSVKGPSPTGLALIGQEIIPSSPRISNLGLPRGPKRFGDLAVSVVSRQSPLRDAKCGSHRERAGCRRPPRPPQGNLPRPIVVVPSGRLAAPSGPPGPVRAPESGCTAPVSCGTR